MKTMRREEEVSGREEYVEAREAIQHYNIVLSSLKQPLRELLDTMMESLSGEKLKINVALFYGKLKESSYQENQLRK